MPSPERSSTSGSPPTYHLSAFAIRTTEVASVMVSSISGPPSDSAIEMRVGGSIARSASMGLVFLKTIPNLPAMLLVAKYWFSIQE
ncbi:hypothetical protein CKO16_22095 [Rhodoblastus acidophilus]|nr:hypothetical protein CKO16_22095 [Rhodoblastus acidophilus]